MKSLLVTAAATLLAGPVFAADLGTMRGSWPAAGVREVRVEFPVGGLEIIGTTGGTQVEVEMRVKCKRWGKCEEKAKDLEIITDIEGGVRRIEIRGYPKVDTDALELRLQVLLPATLAIQVDMGVGDLEVRQVEGDVDVELGVGEADVRVPAKAVSSVECEVGVGDANVHGTDGERRSSGLLIGRTVRWQGNEGGSRVHLEVGVGDADVWLR
jgi:hypothetical protein